MMVILSPAKTLNFEPVNLKVFSHPRFLNQAEYLINVLKKYNPQELSQLMKISYQLAQTNYERIIKWDKYHGPPEAKQAILAYNGDVYEGLNAKDFGTTDFDFAQNNLRIISGLYGLLRPLDLIHPYRLEMGINLPNHTGKNLYVFWSELVTNQLIDDIEQLRSKNLINLASFEYFKVFKLNKLSHLRIISPEFKEFKNGKYTIVSFFAKRARGLMTNYIITNKIHDAEQLKLFHAEGYEFAENVSTPDKWVFVR